MILDTSISDTGTDAASSISATPQKVGLPLDADRSKPEVIAKLVADTIFRMPFDDSIGMCKLNNYGLEDGILADLLKAATGWDFTAEEIKSVGYRIINLLRVFNLRHGHTAFLDYEGPSVRYISAPIDGAYQGMTIAPVWQDTVRNYYKLMGWDVETSRPLPETLRHLGLEHTIKDIW